MGRNLKILISIILIVLLGGVVTLYAYVDSNSTATNLQSTAQQHTNHDDIIHGMIDELYYDEKKDFLSEGLTIEQIDQVRSEIETFNLSTSDKNKYLQEVEEVNQRFEAQKAINDFFAGTRDAIRGNEVTADLQYRNNLTQEAVLEVKEAYYYELEAIEEAESSESGDEVQTDETAHQLDEFQLTINRFIDQAEKDLDGPQVVKTALETVKEIDIVDGNIGRIALAMDDFDQELLKVEESHPEVFDNMNNQANDYSLSFLEEVIKIAETIPQYYDILLIAVEPSERLLELLQSNSSLFIEENTIEEVTENGSSANEVPVDTPNYDVEYEYEDDYYEDSYYNDYQPPVSPQPEESDEEQPGVTPSPTEPGNQEEQNNPSNNQQDRTGFNSLT